MKKGFYFAILTCFFSMLLFSCKKEKNDLKLNRLHHLKENSWRVLELKSNGDVIPLECRADDTWIFESGHGYIDEGAENCTDDFTLNKENNQNLKRHFHYTLTGNQQNIVIREAVDGSLRPYLSSGSVIDASIRLMNENRLIITYYNRKASNDTFVNHYYELMFARR